MPGAKRKKTKYYAVRKGYIPGIYQDWPNFQDQIIGYSGAQFKVFTTKKEAQTYMRQSNENENPEDTVRKQTNNKSISTQTEDQSQVDSHGDETESWHEEFIVLDEVDRFTEMEERIKETKSEISNLWSYLDILLDMISEDKAESKVKDSFSPAVLPTEASPPPSLFPDTPSRLFEMLIEQHSLETGPPDIEQEILMYDLREENEKLKEERDKLDQKYHHLVLTNNEPLEDIKFYKNKAEMIEEAYQTLINDGRRFHNEERSLNADSNNWLWPKYPANNVITEQESVSFVLENRFSPLENNYEEMEFNKYGCNEEEMSIHVKI